jgi:acyl-CoA synthetase (NDP forming)
MRKLGESLTKKLDRVFNPRSVAVVGDKQALGYMWLRSLSHFQGKVYSVQIDPNELPGIAQLSVKNYLSLKDIPGPVDYVIAAVPRAVAPRIVKDCIQKNVGGVCFFTSGFAETGTEEGIRLQQAITDLAREVGLLVIGPNCVGIYNPKIGLRHSSLQAYGEGGTVGFIAQSGTHATLFTIAGTRNGIKFSKSVSYGNAAILDSTDYLEYLKIDRETEIIGMYVEAVKDGRRFFHCLRDIAERKPVLIWRGGESEEGARATASHTGALAQSSVVWQTLIRQCGAIRIENLDEMIDTVKALLYLKPATGNRVGLIAMSGGQSVAIADTFAQAGLKVPLLSQSSYERLSTFFSIIGGSYRNPFDISSSFLMSENAISNLANMLDVMEQDTNIDCIVLELFTIISPFSQDLEKPDPLLDTILEFKDRTKKPFLTIVTTAHSETLAVEIRDRLTGKGIPCFPSFERGARALKRLVDFYRFRQEQYLN